MRVGNAMTRNVQGCDEHDSLARATQLATTVAVVAAVPATSRSAT